jgi:hypothetical protein
VKLPVIGIVVSLLVVGRVKLMSTNPFALVPRMVSLSLMTMFKVDVPQEEVSYLNTLVKLNVLIFYI